MIILLSGYAGSGKDEAASFLTKHHLFNRVSFADKLKEVTSDLVGLPISYFHDRSLKDSPLYEYPVTYTDHFTTMVNDHIRTEFQEGCHTPRSLLIAIGNIMRAVDPQFWVKKVLQQVITYENVAISDWRFPAEAEIFKRQRPDVYTVRIDRYEARSTAESERALDDYKFDYVIRNKGSLRDFHNNLNKLMETLNAKI